MVDINVHVYPKPKTHYLSSTLYPNVHRLFDSVGVVCQAIKKEIVWRIIKERWCWWKMISSSVKWKNGQCWIYPYIYLYIYKKSALEASSEPRECAEDCPLIWRELIFHSVRSGGLAVVVSLFSAVPGSCVMPPTLFGKELKYYSPHKDTKQRLTAQWAAADSQPNIWWCSKIQAGAVLQRFRLHCCSARPGSVLQVSAGPFSWPARLGRPLLLKPGTKPILYFEEIEINCSWNTS